MEKINFEDGQLVKSGYVEIDGTKYPTVEAEYDGATPLSSFVLNKMQENIESAINNVDLTDYYNKTEVDEKIDNIQALPVGGTTGQVLTKQSDTDGDVEWSTVEGNEVYIGNEADAPATTKIVIDEEETGWEDETEKVKKYTINTIIDNGTTNYATDLPSNCNIIDIKAIIKGNNAVLPVPFILADKYLYVSITQINITPTILVRTNDVWSNFMVEVIIKYKEV